MILPGVLQSNSVISRIHKTGTRCSGNAEWHRCNSAFDPDEMVRRCCKSVIGNNPLLTFINNAFVSYPLNAVPHSVRN